MKIRTKLKIAILLLTICSILLILTVLATLYDIIYVTLSLILLPFFTFLIGYLLNIIIMLNNEALVQKMLYEDTYTKLEIGNTDNIPFCIQVALEENNITFYGKYRITNKGKIIVCIISKKDDQFFAEEILTEKGPIFMKCDEFLEVFYL